VGKVAAGLMDEQELALLEQCACPGAGSCSGMFTANRPTRQRHYPCCPCGEDTSCKSGR
jgi:hypothetical protein